MDDLATLRDIRDWLIAFRPLPGPEPHRVQAREAHGRRLALVERLIAERQPPFGGHCWIEHDGLIVCKRCTVVRRADDRNKPCRGVVRVTTREGDSSVTPERVHDALQRGAEDYERARQYNGRRR